MKNINFAFKQDGGLTLEWQQDGSRVGYIRLHKGEAPGPVTHSLVVELYSDKTFEFKMMKKEYEHSEPFREKLMDITRWLREQGYTGGDWYRFNEERLKKVKIPENYLTTSVANEDTPK